MTAPGQTYQIRVNGHLDNSWLEWFDGLALTCEAGGTTLISGPLPDQAALHGTLLKIRNLNLELVSVIPVTPATDNEQPCTAHNHEGERTT